MKKNFTYLLTTFIIFMECATALAQGSGIYVGGHIRRNRPTSIATLKASGFKYVILFNVQVETDGTLTTDNEIICKNGVYVFSDVQPYYQADIKSLKTAPTSIERVEICIGGWGNTSYNNIQTLINANGTGAETMLYKNFKALKEAVPEIEAVNNDDESCYNVSSAVAFHSMMYELGYKTTLAPYTYLSFWKSLATQLNNKYEGACDRIMVQCYDGGASNNPSDWNINGITLHAGRTNYQTDMNTSINQMQTWKNNNGVTGGFVWVYNDETWNLNQWATAMNRIFGCTTTDRPVVTAYSENSYAGYAISLPEGDLYKAVLAAYGITTADIASLKILPGFKFTLYRVDNFLGSSSLVRSWTANTADMDGTWDNRCVSAKIEAFGTSAKNGDYKIKSKTTNLYWDIANSSTEEAANLLEKNNGNISQGFRLIETSNGIYHIMNINSGKYLTMAEKPSANRYYVTQKSLVDNYVFQEWILVDKSNGYFQFVSRYNGRVLEVPSNATGDGSVLRTYINSDQESSLWAMETYTTGIDNINGDNTSKTIISLSESNLIVKNANGQKLSIFDLSGRNIQQTAITSDDMKVNISLLSCGSYIVKAGKCSTVILKR